MHRDKLAAFRAAITGIVLMPLINIAPAAKIHQKHIAPASLPISIQTARISCIAFALLCWFSIPFINRHALAKETDNKMSNSGLHPEMVLLLLDLSLLLAPALIVLILSFLGYPIVDVYLYSYSIFIAMLLWLFWKRNIFWSTDVIAVAPNKELQSEKSYTAVLAVLGLLALAFLALKIILMVSPPDGYIEPLQWNFPWALIYGLIVTGCAVTVTMRLIHSPRAFDVTAFISILLAFWVPFGTAAYIYWRFKIKSRELPVQNNED
jgi:hypothetical protein